MCVHWAYLNHSIIVVDTGSSKNLVGHTKATKHISAYLKDTAIRDDDQLMSSFALVKNLNNLFCFLKPTHGVYLQTMLFAETARYVVASCCVATIFAARYGPFENKIKVKESSPINCFF